MAFKEKTIEELGEWLKSEGFGDNTVNIFAKNEIDGEAFLLLSNEDVKDLVKLVGPRTKLLKKRCQLLKQDEPWSPPVPQPLEIDVSVTGSSVLPEKSIDGSTSSKSCDATQDDVCDSDFEEQDSDIDLSPEVDLSESEPSPSVVPEDGVVMGSCSALEGNGDQLRETESDNVVLQPPKKAKLDPAVVKIAVPSISKRKQESRLPRPFQLPVNFNPTIADALRNETLSGRARTKFVSVIAETIFRYKSYPTTEEYEHVAQQIVKKWPFLSKSGSYGYLVVALREKMAYKRKPDDCKRGKKSDKPYKSKAPQMPMTSSAPLPGIGEDEASHNRHVTLLKAEGKKVNPNKHSCRELMKRTFSFRRQALLQKPLSVDQLMTTYPAIKYPDEIIREFDRVNDTPLSKTIQETWEALVPIIIKLAQAESCGAIITMIDGADDFTEEYRSVVATCVLYHMIPDVRMKQDHTRIVTIVEGTADIKAAARDVPSPQPCIIVRENDGMVKDAYLVIERAPLINKVPIKDMLLVLFLDKKIPPRKPRLSALVSQLRDSLSE